MLAIVVSCTTVYLVAAPGFWLVEGRGLELLYMVVSGFLAGLFVPVPLFPGWLRAVATATPFPSMMSTRSTCSPAAWTCPPRSGWSSCSSAGSR